MNCLDAAFARGRAVLIAYLPLGDPEAPPELPRLYVEEGVDVLELGVPVAHPWADGEAITASMQRALAADTTPAAASETIAAARAQLPETAMVWMTYASQSEETPGFFDLVGRSGVDGLLLPDGRALGAEAVSALDRRGVHLLSFLPHEPREDDIARARAARGYVMLQAAPGRTGQWRTRLPDSGPAIRRLRDLWGLTAPIALGVGISTPEQARAAIEMGADAVIVGTATLEAALAGETELRRFLRRMRAALDG